MIHSQAVENDDFEVSLDLIRYGSHSRSAPQATPCIALNNHLGTDRERFESVCCGVVLL